MGGLWHIMFKGGMRNPYHGVIIIKGYLVLGYREIVLSSL